METKVVYEVKKGSPLDKPAVIDNLEEALEFYNKLKAMLVYDSITLTKVTREEIMYEFVDKSEE